MMDMLSDGWTGKKSVANITALQINSYFFDSLTGSKLLNSHEREADEREGFPQNLLFVLRGQRKLLPVTLSLRPADHRSKQTVLPDA